MNGGGGGGLVAAAQGSSQDTDTYRSWLFNAKMLLADCQLFMPWLTCSL